ncbi:MAG TPA: DUF937 domain-containing protein [Rhodobacteraceae bacterium]|nr:DUF937 domain-containing protein [Paracoccaceae bacterium]
MSIMNLISMGMKYLGPVVVTKLASMLGIKSPMVTKAIVAALPAILAALTGKATKSSGAGSILDMILGQKTPDPKSFEEMVASGNVDDIRKSGLEGLMGMLGDSNVDTLSKALSRYSGVPDDGAKTLLGLLSPAAIGPLKTVVEEKGLDAEGFASFLEEQKPEIAKAMPGDFARELEGTGLLDAIQDHLPRPAAAVREVQQVAENTGGGMMKWLLPLVVIAGLGWYFFGNRAPEAMPEAMDQSVMVGEVDLGAKLGSVVDGLSSSLGAIKSPDDATAVLPDLQKWDSELASLNDMASQLPDTAKSSFGTMVSNALATLQPLIETVLATVGEDSALKPILDGIVAKLNAMAG